jgi:hypothetical protein
MHQDIFYSLVQKIYSGKTMSFITNAVSLYIIPHLVLNLPVCYVVFQNEIFFFAVQLGL